MKAPGRPFLGLGLLPIWLPTPALAAPRAGVPALAWGLPFLGLLLSIALIPMLAPGFYHRRMSLIAAFWAVALLAPMAAASGIGPAAALVWGTFLTEYLPFVTLLLALFVAAGGIVIRGGSAGSPGGNTVLLGAGTLLAGMIGTTGAAMLLIHPLLGANAYRTRRTHLVIFFTILVANAGGALSPLGDPPLFLGFLHGVPFFWPLQYLAAPLLVLTVPLLIVFYWVDRWFARTEPARPPPEGLRIRGGRNVVLLGVVVVTVLVGGYWHPGEIVLFGQSVAVERLAGIGVFLVVALVSTVVTPRALRQGNLFSWHPMVEVATLFAAIFVTIAPVFAMLDAGLHGPFAPVLRLMADASGVPRPLIYFWLTGVSSAFLDNAPTYLVFFGLAGDDPVRLTSELNRVLQAIASGAVFFGGLSYIGNAPNLMIRSIASHRGVRMPDFLGFIALSGVLLLPGLLVLSVVFFR